MAFNGFTNSDFALFSIPYFDERMAVIKNTLHPKLFSLGEVISTNLSKAINVNCFPHLATHPKRKTDLPLESWVAISPSQKSYKPYVHFIIAVSEFGVHGRVVLLEDAKIKEKFGQELRDKSSTLALSLKQKGYCSFVRKKVSDLPSPIWDIHSFLYNTAQELLRQKGSFLDFGRYWKKDDISIMELEFVEKLIELLLDLLPIYQLV